MRKRILCLIMTLGIPALTFISCYKETEPNKLIVETKDKRPRWGETVKLKFKPEVEFDTIWLYVYSIFSDTVEETTLVMEKHAKIHTAQVKIPEKLFRCYITALPDRFIGEMSDYLQTRVLLNPEETENINPEEFLTSPDTHLAKYIRNGNCNQILPYISFWILNIPHDSARTMTNIMREKFGNTPHVKKELVRVYGHLQLVDTVLAILESMNNPDEILFLPRAYSIAEYELSEDSSASEKLHKFLTRLLEKNDTLNFGWEPIEAFKSGKLPKSLLHRYAKSLWKNFNTKQINKLDELWNCWIVARETGDSMMCDEIMNFAMEFIKSGKFRRIDIYSMAELFIPAAVKHFQEKYPPEKMLELCNIAFTEIGSFMENFEEKALIHRNRANALIALGRKNEALTDALVLYTITNDTADAKILREITGISADSSLKLYREKIANVLPSLPMDFKLVTLEKDTILPSDLSGKIVILNFWGTGCKPCIAEFQVLAQIAEWAEPRGIICLAITSQGDSEARIRKIVSENNPEYTICCDAGNRLLESLKVSSIPQHFVIDRKGIIRYRTVGGIDNPSQIIKRVYPLLSLKG